MDSNTHESCFPLEKYRSYLHILAKSELDHRLAGKVDVSGVIQQTLLDAHQCQKQPDPTNSTECLTWLRKLLARNLIDEIRKFRAEKRDIEREICLEDNLNRSAVRMSGILADNSTPSQRAVSNEQIMQLSRALQQLPESQQTAIVHRYFFNAPLGDLAKQLNRSETAVAGLIKRGLARLRELMEAKEDGP